MTETAQPYTEQPTERMRHAQRLSRLLGAASTLRALAGAWKVNPAALDIAALRFIADGIEYQAQGLPRLCGSTILRALAETWDDDPASLDPTALHFLADSIESRALEALENA